MAKNNEIKKNAEVADNAPKLVVQVVDTSKKANKEKEKQRQLDEAQKAKEEAARLKEQEAAEKAKAKADKKNGVKPEAEPVAEPAAELSPEEAEAAKAAAVEEKKQAKAAKKTKNKEKKMAARYTALIFSTLFVVLGAVIYFHELIDGILYKYFGIMPLIYNLRPYLNFVAMIPLALQIIVGFIFLFAIPATKVDYREREEEVEEEKDDGGVLVEIPTAPVNVAPVLPDGPINFDKYNKTDVEEINGALYSEVAKYPERIRILEKLGATDLDIIQTNMTGNADFEKLLSCPRTRTLSVKDVCAYAMTKPGMVTIKKRGAINWTFKYAAKSYMIIREGKDGYKVSIKCWPDAAVRLNEVYKALEDSNFPSGPVWFCFSELRNLPPDVVKWLVDEAFRIAKLQQLKTDKLKDSKPLSAYTDIDGSDIKTQYLMGKNILTYEKYSLVFQKGVKPDLATLLITPPEGLDTSKYTKEMYYKFVFNPELSVTMLPEKNCSEDLINGFFEYIENIMLKAQRKAGADELAEKAAEEAKAAAEALAAKSGKRVEADDD